MNNKELGNKFEKDFAEYLASKGYWAHYIEGAAHTGSQPCDIVASKRDCMELYDCKTLEKKNGLFPLYRVEENQRLAFQRFRECQNIKSTFSLAILWNDDLYFVDFDNIDFTQKSIDLKKLFPFIRGFYENFSR